MTRKQQKGIVVAVPSSSSSSSSSILLWFFLLMLSSLQFQESLAASAARTRPDVFVTLSPDAWQFSCFDTNDNNENENDFDYAGTQNREDCCREIASAYKELAVLIGDAMLFPRFTKRKLLPVCREELAPVPKLNLSNLDGNDDDEDSSSSSSFSSWWAKYSLVTMLDHPFPPMEGILQIRQFSYKKQNGNSINKSLQEVPISASSPLSPSPLIRPDPTVTTTTIDSNFAVSSNLSDHGGMHRLVQHTLQSSSSSSKTDTTQSFFLVWMIPTGLFVDLEQFLLEEEAVGSSSTTTTTMYKVHSAQVCDIEQPAFSGDSGQHVIVIEIIRNTTTEAAVDKDDDLQKLLFQFTTRIHWRYPTPGDNKVKWLEPHAFGINSNAATSMIEENNKEVGNEGDDETTATTTASIIYNIVTGQQTENTFQVHVLQVSSGNPNDYDLVQWMTIFSCIVGVVIMLMDISQVSRWDDTANRTTATSTTE